MTTPLRCAVLDDVQGAATALADRPVRVLP